MSIDNQYLNINKLSSAYFNRTQMNIKRRDFIKNSFILTGGFCLPSSLSALSFHTPRQPLRIRKNVNTLGPADPDLLAYRHAVEVMKARPASDPTSWAFQANIHDQFCPHQNWFFLPWHRAYILKFEEICRQASGVPSFCLPYWDWTLNPKIPQPFKDTSSPLYESSRRAAANGNGSALAEFVGQTAINSILNISPFQDFASAKTSIQKKRVASGRLEGGPHNHIHNFVGGKMADAKTAALDPIFWLHHANVDRLWNAWNINGHLNSVDSVYTNHLFQANFYGADGLPVDFTVSSLSSVAALGYTYEGQSAPFAPASILPSTFVLLDNSPIKSNAVARVQPFQTATLTLDGFSALFDRAFVNPTARLKPKSRYVTAVISGELTRDEDFYVRVFINGSHVTKHTPITDPHYLGSFTFFALSHVHGHGEMMEHHEKQTVSFSFDITSKLKELFGVGQRNSSQKKPADKINFQLLTIPYKDGGKAEFLDAKVEVFVTQEA